MTLGRRGTDVDLLWNEGDKINLAHLDDAVALCAGNLIDFLEELLHVAEVLELAHKVAVLVVDIAGGAVYRDVANSFDIEQVRLSWF